MIRSVHALSVPQERMLRSASQRCVFPLAPDRHTLMASSSSTVLMVANWDWVLYNFRLSLAKTLREEGYRLTFVCPRGKHVADLQAEGFDWIEWPLQRRSLNPVTEGRAIWNLAQIYSAVSPALIHHDTIKPNVYGALATWLNQQRNAARRPPQVINSFMGIGFLFSNRPLARWLRPLVLPIMRFGMRRDHVFTTFSNQGDRETFVQQGLVRPSQTQVIVSEFVDTDSFHLPSSPSSANASEPDEYPVRVLVAARLLWDKGIGEFVDAARDLRQRGLPVEFVVAGEPDTNTPGYVPEAQLQDWDDEGVIEWIGYCSDMPSLLRRVDVAALPTYYNEGLPRFLVEAAASGLPLIATDIDACRRVVNDGDNGYLISRRDPQSLADAVADLVRHPQRRHRMGKRSRARAKAEFAKHVVVSEWLDLYDRHLHRRSSSPISESTRPGSPPPASG